MIGKLEEYVLGSDWTEYFERFEIFARSNKIAEEDKLGVLLVVMGAKAYSTLKILINGENPVNLSLEMVRITLDEYFSPTL